MEEAEEAAAQDVVALSLLASEAQPTPASLEASNPGVCVEPGRIEASSPATKAGPPVAEVKLLPADLNESAGQVEASSAAAVKQLPEKVEAPGPTTPTKPLAGTGEDDLFYAKPEAFCTRQEQFPQHSNEAGDPEDDEGFYDDDKPAKKKKKGQPKAKGRPKGKAKAKNAPKAKAKASAKSKAKASAKSRAAASPKSKAKAAASPKSKAKAKASPKSKAKARASPKSKAKATGAVEPAPGDEELEDQDCPEFRLIEQAIKNVEEEEALKAALESEDAQPLETPKRISKAKPCPKTKEAMEAFDVPAKKLPKQSRAPKKMDPDANEAW